MEQKSSIYSERQVKLQQEAVDAKATQEAELTRPGKNIPEEKKKDTNLPYEGSETQRREQMESAARRPLYPDSELKRTPSGRALIENRKFYEREALKKQMRDK